MVIDDVDVVLIRESLGVSRQMRSSDEDRLICLVVLVGHADELLQLGRPHRDMRAVAFALHNHGVTIRCRCKNVSSKVASSSDHTDVPVSLTSQEAGNLLLELRRRKEKKLAKGPSALGGPLRGDCSSFVGSSASPVQECTGSHEVAKQGHQSGLERPGGYRHHREEEATADGDTDPERMAPRKPNGSDHPPD
jgi:hypothetical protein